MPKFQPFWRLVQPVFKEGFFVVWDIEPGGSGYESMFQPGTSTPVGLGNATIKEGFIEKSTKAKTLGSIEIEPTELPGLHGQVYNAKFCKLEAESEEEAIKFAGEAYGKKTGGGYAVKITQGAFKKG